LAFRTARRYVRRCQSKNFVIDVGLLHATVLHKIGVEVHPVAMASSDAGQAK
jgi:hypothetical protein